MRFTPKSALAVPLLTVALSAAVTPPAAASSVSLGQPGNWATTPIPARVALDPSLSPQGAPLTTQVPLELAGQATGMSWVNTWAYTAKTYYVPLSTPLQPVRLCRYNGYCVPNWGPPVNDLWHAAMGEGNAATVNRATGKPIADQSLGGGIPVTSAMAGSPGTDKSATVCLGGGSTLDPPWTLTNTDGSVFTRPDGQEIQGNCWELWGLQPDPTYNPSLPVSPANTAWMISWGAHRTGFLDQSAVGTSTTYPLDTLSGTYIRPSLTTWYGPWVGVPGDRRSTTFDHGWGVTAAQTPLLTDVVQQSDCQAVLNGAPNFGHAIGVQLQYTRIPPTGSWWPGGASDGNSSQVATTEGMRVYFKSTVSMPSGLTPSAQALFRTLQTYGAVIDDETAGGPPIQDNPDGSYQSGGSLMIRSDLDLTGTGACAKLGITTALKGIPWGQVSGPIKQGSDLNTNPAS